MNSKKLTRSLEHALKNSRVHGKASAPDKLSATFVHAIRFGIVGITATAVHLGIALSLNVLLDITALVSNSVAFCGALLVSYFGNLRWAFGTQQHNVLRAGKFLLTAFSGFIINTVILAFLVSKQIFPDALAIIVSVFFVPLVTFVAFKFWVFSR